MKSFKIYSFNERAKTFDFVGSSDLYPIKFLHLGLSHWLKIMRFGFFLFVCLFVFFTGSFAPLALLGRQLCPYPFRGWYLHANGF